MLVNEVWCCYLHVCNMLSKNIGITESYIQVFVFKKTLKNMSFEYRRGTERLDETEDKSMWT
ncbi:hypothetical protein PAEPH01_0869 [Pancytospora epiphaga]|nr:hypothetical protein PAEPH01_0869 [Pancytospora epiphaga]